MASAPTVLKGIIHGKVIQLEREPGLPDGQVVSVEIRPVSGDPSWMDRFDIDPAVVPGKLVLKGTRLLAEELAQLIEGGCSDEDLIGQYPELTPEDVAALRQYARVPQGLRRAFGAWAEDGEELEKYLEWNRQQRKLNRREIPE